MSGPSPGTFCQIKCTPFPTQEAMFLPLACPPPGSLKAIKILVAPVRALGGAGQASGAGDRQPTRCSQDTSGQGLCPSGSDMRDQWKGHFLLLCSIPSSFSSRHELKCGTSLWGEPASQKLEVACPGYWEGNFLEVAQTVESSPRKCMSLSVPGLRPYSRGSFLLKSWFVLF